MDKNTEKITNLEKKVDENTSRINKLEEGRKRDRRDILDILDRMEKSISGQFDDVRESIDAKLDRIYTAQIINDIEHIEFRQIIKANSAKLRIQDSRITDLENWKQDIEDGGYSVAGI